MAIPVRPLVFAISYSTSLKWPVVFCQVLKTKLLKVLKTIQGNAVEKAGNSICLCLAKVRVSGFDFSLHDNVTVM